MKFNNILLCWLAFSVFFSATFVQLHQIEHIIENINNDSNYSHTKQDNTALDSAIDQCDTCIQSSHVAFSLALSQNINLFKQTDISVNPYSNPIRLSKNKHWTALQPRAPPTLKFS